MVVLIATMDCDCHVRRIVSLQREAPPRFKLVGECVIEPTDATFNRRDAHEGVSDFSRFVR